MQQSSDLDWTKDTSQDLEDQKLGIVSACHLDLVSVAASHAISPVPLNPFCSMPLRQIKMKPTTWGSIKALLLEIPTCTFLPFFFNLHPTLFLTLPLQVILHRPMSHQHAHPCDAPSCLAHPILYMPAAEGGNFKRWHSGLQLLLAASKVLFAQLTASLPITKINSWSSYIRMHVRITILSKQRHLLTPELQLHE